ncbi:UDP-N-acetylmuramoyl-L-alanine--D-glutamate ligase [Acidovorax lacteus]|uniref:UDP-N-acetylmuramoylalanine--D-glutamate ligase n=1 Tax=Acidovorax lacteus TaxID=1924988 RepID=A0ABP8KYL4_9BURK
MNTPEQTHVPAADSPEQPTGLAMSADVLVPEVEPEPNSALSTPADEDVPRALSVESAPLEPVRLAEPAYEPGSAARAAKAFVHQIFAEVAAPDAEAADDTPADAAAPSVAPDATLDQAPVPAGWPAGGEPLPLQGRKVLVLGLGASGLAMARWCVRAGAEVTVADTREAPPQLAVLQAALPGVRFVAGALTATLIEGQGYAAVYRSPGLLPATIAPVWSAAQAQGLVTGGELDLFAQALIALRTAHGYAPAVLAITGTNGKTTVTSLTAQLVEHAGRSVAVAGNIGPTLLDTLAERIDGDSLPEAWVLELSSFQLDGVRGFEPTAATVLNLTQDHLDWHGDMAAYGMAKSRIFGGSGLLVLNRDDPEVMQMLPPPVRVKLQKPQQRPHVTFGADMPRRPGDFGIEVVSGMAWLVRAQEADETRKRSRAAVDEDELHVQRLMPADALRIRGRHNALNALAALALATAAGCSLAPMLYGLREYRGEPHRVESVAVVQDVEYFDDSKGTNVGATAAALAGLGADRRLVVILGGEGKGQDFSPLATPVARYARAVLLIGRDAPRIREALTGTGVPMLDAPDLPEAVRMAAQRAHAGDAVLLSPACASFDMFRDYAHRAQVFCDAVRALALDAGQSLEGQ